MKRLDPDAGLSLLELAAVLAIFSVLSLMGIQLLSQSMANRDAIATVDARVAALTSAVSVLRRDFEQAIPAPNQPQTAPYLDIAANAIRLETASGGGGSRVIWRLDPAGRRLLRETVGNGEAVSLLSDVDAMRVEVVDAGSWIDGAVWRPAGPADLPRGFRVVLTLADFGEVPIVVAR